MEMQQAIQARRSIRRYTSAKPKPEHIEQIITAGTWAPSGLNNQPWRFKVVEGKLKDGLAQFTKYAAIIQAAPIAVCVFLDKEAMYDRDKDCMAIGACIQNMLLAAHELGYGTCWLGEILKKKDAVHAHLTTPLTCELLAVITLGSAAANPGKGTRRPTASFLL